MAANDLHDNLRAKERRPPRRLPAFAPAFVIAGVVLALVVGVWVALVDDPNGGRAVAVATVADSAPQATGSISSDGAAADGGAGQIAPDSPEPPDGLEVAGLPAVPNAASS